MSAVIALVVGLANPGIRYEQTRHNAGEWLVDRWVRGHGGSFKAESKFHGSVAEVFVQGHKVRAMVPATYMNESGRAVAAVASFYRIETAAVLVAHDELDLPPGTVRFKQGGGPGGHNGLKDIIRHLDRDFARLRIGIGHPGNADDVTGYVLGRPSVDDRRRIDDSIDAALRCMDDFVVGQVQRAMTALHTQDGPGRQKTSVCEAAPAGTSSHG